MKPYNVVQFGFGSLGTEIFKTLQQRKDFKIVGVVDVDPNKVGKDAGLLTLNKKIGVKVVQRIREVKPKPHVCIHATTSSFSAAYSQIEEIVKNRISVISTCEELVYPVGRNAKLAKQLDRLAKKFRVRVLGIGINPGFVMDFFVLMLAKLCSNIESIRVERVVDVTKRRKALHEKMCLGLSVEQYDKVKERVGHVGLIESANMICDSIGAKGLTFATSKRPVVANRMITSGIIPIKPGRIAGIEHHLIGKRNNVKFLEMVLYMYAEASEFDLVEIEGRPPIYVRTNGISGDEATIALLLNYIPMMLEASPGLHTVDKLQSTVYLQKEQ